MRITQEADYALRIACCLAEKGGIMDAKSISEEIEVSVGFSLKILRKLSIGGAVKSYKGAYGGYKLTKDPKEISMLNIIELIDGPMAISKCIYEDKECSKSGLVKEKCILHNVFREISNDAARKLNKISLYDLTNPQTSIEAVIDIMNK